MSRISAVKLTDSKSNSNDDDDDLEIEFLNELEFVRSIRFERRHM